jgi:hypothetical protein
MRLVRELVVTEAPHKADEWFTYEVIAVGPRITVRLNGRETVAWVDPNWRYKSGHFALQVNHPLTLVQFRKIEVKELPRSAD